MKGGRESDSAGKRMQLKNQKTGTGAKAVYNTLMTAALFTLILCASVSLIIYTTPLYYMMVKLLKVPESTGISFEVCKRNYDTLIYYNCFWGPKKLVFPDFIMSEHGEIHFMEVKRIFVFMQYAAIGSLALVLLGHFLYGKKRRIYGFLPATIILACVVVLVVGAGLVFSWDRTFILMHRILFTNDYWIFDPAKDPVINILPDTVFLAAGAGIIVLMILGLLISGLLWRKHQKEAK